jgi:hypothetical protein
LRYPSFALFQETDHEIRAASFGAGARPLRRRRARQCPIRQRRSSRTVQRRSRRRAAGRHPGKTFAGASIQGPGPRREKINLPRRRRLRGAVTITKSFTLPIARALPDQHSSARAESSGVSHQRR